MYHTHVFIYNNDWFWMRSVLEYPLHADPRPSIFEFLEALADYCYGKNQALLYSQTSSYELQKHRFEIVNLSRPNTLGLRFVVQVASIHICIIINHYFMSLHALDCSSNCIDIERITIYDR